MSIKMHCVTLNERQVTFRPHVGSPDIEFRITLFKYLL